MTLLDRIGKFLGEEVYPVCKNYSIADGTCKITCTKINITVGDKCPFPKQQQYKCPCYRR